jgi:hypothetical protein
MMQRSLRWKIGGVNFLEFGIRKAKISVHPRSFRLHFAAARRAAVKIPAVRQFRSKNFVPWRPGG